MTTHPTHEQLFEAADSGESPAELSKHLDACAACSAAYGRLRVGALLLDDARDSQPDLDWARIDAALQAEGDRVAAGIRVGTIRAPRPWRVYAGGATALAAAAAAGLYLAHGGGVVPHEPSNDLASSHELTPALAASHAIEGAIFLAAGGATRTPAGAMAPGRLATSSAIHEGDRLQTAAAGRALVALQPTVALDVRPDSDVTITAMRDDGATVTLARGEVAIDREGDARPVSVRAGRWTVSTEGDAVVRVESHVVRVVILAGHGAVEADGVPRVEYGGPLVLELPEAAPSRTVVTTATDPLRLDMAYLFQRGTLRQLPPIDPAALLSVAGRGPLPSGVEALRVDGPTTLQARIGHTLMTLEIGSGNLLQWHRVPGAPVVAAAQPNANHAPTLGAIQAPEPEAQALTRAQRSEIERSFAQRLSHCITTCREQNRCAEHIAGVVDVAVENDGRVSLASVDSSAEGARLCLVNETRSMGGPRNYGALSFQIPLH